MDIERCKEEYAELLVTVGICLKPGERVLIHSDVSIWKMAELVAKTAYQHGASKVDIHWSSGRSEALDYAYGDLEVLKRVEEWEEKKAELQGKELPCVIYLLSSEPINYTPEMVMRQSEVTVARLAVLLKYREAMQDKYKWTIGGVPTQSWANQVFPGELGNLNHLWKDIFQTVLINGDKKSPSRWARKWEQLWAHMDQLNRLKLQFLHLKTGLGTDLTVELHPDGLWKSGANREEGYVANLPTEELFTSPLAGKAEGVIVASCPIVYSNQLIDGLCLEFQNGKVTKVTAKEGEAFFQQLVKTDEGAAMLGEVAIVDKHAPVGKLGHLMYHTLYDENAACHVAIGRGFPFVLKNFADLSDKERQNCGLNQSGIHCDIMFGTEDTTITGLCRDGKKVTLFSNGEWCI